MFKKILLLAWVKANLLSRRLLLIEQSIFSVIKPVSEIHLNLVYRTREQFTGKPGSGSHHSSAFKDLPATMTPFHAKGHLFTSLMLTWIIRNVLASL